MGFLDKYKFQGVTLDFEDVPETAQKDLQSFLTELNVAFAAHDYAIVLAVPFDDDAWPYQDYAELADYMMLMGYDQHWDEGTPGSIAGAELVRRRARQAHEDARPAAHHRRHRQLRL